MKKLLEISDEDIGLKSKLDVKYHPRTAARAVIIKNNVLALLHVSKHNYYKLPGGGVDEGETIQAALDREVKEEVGCTIRIIKEIGEIIEHRSKFGIVQTSHCYLAELVKEGTPAFTGDEIEAGFELVWVPLDKAVELVKNSKTDAYDGKFIVKRDLIFLQEAKFLISD